jgi:hypothetical protein
MGSFAAIGVSKNVRPAFDPQTDHLRLPYVRNTLCNFAHILLWQCQLAGILVKLKNEAKKIGQASMQAKRGNLRI